MASSLLRRPELRAKIIRTITDVQMQPCAMELMTATAEKPRNEAARALMSRCDAVVFLIAWCYGPIPDDEERSLLEIQYDWACELELPRLVYIIDHHQPVIIDRDFDEPEGRWSKQGCLDAFKARLQSEGGTADFTPDNVAARLVHGLLEWRQRALAARELEASGPSAGATSADPERSRREAEAIEALAEVYCDGDDARRMAKSAGFPRRALPNFTTPQTFWSRLVEEARNGMLPGGIRPLIDGAVKDYPNNETFARIAHELAHSPLAPAPSPASSPAPTPDAEPEPGSRAQAGVPSPSPDAVSGPGSRARAQTPSPSPDAEPEPGSRAQAQTPSPSPDAEPEPGSRASPAPAPGSGAALDLAAGPSASATSHISAEPRPAPDADAPSDLPSPRPPRRRRHRTQTAPIDADLSRYLGRVERRNATATMLGASASVELPLDLDEIHTKVRIGSTRPRSSSSPLRRSHRGAEIPLSQAFTRAEQEGYRGVALVGHPGSGKSTHLKRLALWLTRRSATALGLPADTIPVVLPLRAIPDEVHELDHALGLHLERELGFEARFADEVLRRDHLLVLLDGLDDITDDARRRRVLEWLARDLRAHPRRRFFVTGRHPGELEGDPLPPELLEVQLPHLEQSVAQQLVRAWFFAAQGDAPDAEHEAHRRAEALWAELRSPEFREARMFEMTRNPTLLGAMCVLYRERGSLPRRRVEFYEECLDVIIRRSPPVQGLPRRFGDREIRQVLQPLAHWLHGQAGRTQADAAAIAAVIEPYLEAALGYPTDGARFLEAFRDGAGLLRPRGDDGYGFLHLGFQEYLCARHLRSLSHGDPTILDDLVERFGDPWWREVTILLLALGEPPLFDAFMRRLVERRSLVEHQDWVIACIEEAAGASAAPFLELLADEPGHAPERWHRQLAARSIVEATWPDRLEGLPLHEHPLEALRASAPEGGRPRIETIRSARGAYPMALVPAGRFLMGSHHRERHSRWIETPRHEVELEAFWMGLHPVTNEQYGHYLRACPDATEPSYWGDRRYNQPRQPVVGISWHEAAAYCTWAGLALPTEAQWEYACRAGTRAAYWTGHELEDLERAGWYGQNSDQRLHPVAMKRANAFGLYDVHGNVWEWCRDAFGHYRGHPPRAGDGLRHAAEDGHNLVIRGGSWISPADQARCAYRLNRHADNRLSYLGFRAVRALDPDERR